MNTETEKADITKARKDSKLAAMSNYGEYAVPKASSLQNGRPLPNSIQHAASSSSLSAHIPISAGQVVALAREAMRNALGENQTQTTDGKGMDVRTGVTIDLSHKRIQTFPDEVVDIIKNELERYTKPLFSNLCGT